MAESAAGRRPPRGTPDARTDRRSKRTMALLALVAFAPVVIAYVTYYFFPREARVNYGVLIAQPAPPLRGSGFDGKAFDLADLHGRWVLLVAAGPQCADACARMLYATRQARTMQGREQERVVRAVVLTGAEPPPRDILAVHPGLLAVRGDERALSAFPARRDAIYLIDPLGNLVLRYADDPDIKRLAKDLERVLRASAIG
jgi:cytochrome oxidase Cu insertion factor (SCO1/SenC/PrrC family)